MQRGTDLWPKERRGDELGAVESVEAVRRDRSRERGARVEDENANDPACSSG